MCLFHLLALTLDGVTIICGIFRVCGHLVFHRRLFAVVLIFYDWDCSISFWFSRCHGDSSILLELCKKIFISSFVFYASLLLSSGWNAILRLSCRYVVRFSIVAAVISSSQKPYYSRLVRSVAILLVLSIAFYFFQAGYELP